MENINSKYKSDLLQRCFLVTKEIIKYTNGLPNKKCFWIITDQLVRSAASMGANIIEAKSSSSRREFKRYYEISLRSANESKYWLELLIEAQEKDDEQIQAMKKEIGEISNMLAAGVIRLKKKL